MSTSVVSATSTSLHNMRHDHAPRAWAPGGFAIARRAAPCNEPERRFREKSFV
jgi:hypothetical protein